MSLKERFSANLREVRECQGMTQTELAFMTELHRTQISLLERGKRMPRLDTLIKLASVLACSVDELTEGMVWKPKAKTYGAWEVSDAGEDRGDKKTQRAILTFLLAEFPARHTKTTLWWMGLGDPDALEQAIQKLDAVGLLRRDGKAVASTEAARHFDWLELS